MKTTIAGNYLPPQDKQIQAAADIVELKIKAPDFVRDVCNIRAGGRFLNSEELDKELDIMLSETPCKPVQMAGPPKWTGYDHHYNKGQAYSNLHTAREEFRKNRKAFVEKVRHAVNRLPSMDVPGGSPMVQAINLLKILSEMKGKGGGGQGEGSEDDYLDQILDKKNLDAAAEAIKEAQQASQDEMDLLSKLEEIKKGKGPDKEGAGDSGNGISPGTETGMTDKGRAILKAAISMTDKQMREVIKISRRLKSISKLKTSKVSEFIPDTQESEVRNRSMKSYDEVRRMKGTQFSTMVAARSLFNYRTVSQQFLIRERGKFIEKKQLLYMLVDCSGSMVEDTGRRIALAGGVLVNRLMAVAEGDATLYWRFFDTRAHEATYVASKEEAHKSIKSILEVGHYRGGGTNFDQAINAAVAHIESIRETTQDSAKPEIIMVTDGQCHCSLKFKDLKGIKLHTALVSGSSAPGLPELSSESGGIFMDLH